MRLPAPTTGRLLGLAGIALVCTGCPNPNTYGTARTTPKGKLAFTVAPEALGYNVKYDTVDSTGQQTQDSISGVVPILPSFRMRYGVVDQLDLGLHLDNLTSIGLDAKVNLLKGGVDLALDPGIQYYSVSIQSSSSSGSIDESISVTYIHAPILVDINLDDATTLVLSPGVEYSVASSSVASSGSSGVSIAATGGGFFGRLGLGFDFRMSPRFAMHPEVTAMRNFGGDGDLLYMIGLGFNFGAQPDFSDLKEGGGGEPAAPPPAAKPE